MHAIHYFEFPLLLFVVARAAALEMIENLLNEKFSVLFFFFSLIAISNRSNVAVDAVKEKTYP